MNSTQTYQRTTGLRRTMLMNRISPFQSGGMLALALISLAGVAQAAPANTGAGSSTATSPLTPSATDAGPISVEQAVMLGLRRSPATAAAAAGVASSEASYKALSSFSGVNLGATTVTGNSDNYSVTGLSHDTFADVGVVIDTSRQRHDQASSAKFTYLSQKSQLNETVLALEQQIRDAYWTLAAARAQTAFANENYQDAEKTEALTQRQYEVGAAPRADIIRAQISAENNSQSLIAAQASETAAVVALNTLLNRPASAPIQLVDNLQGVANAPDSAPKSAFPEVLPDLTQTTQMAIANRPLVTSADQAISAARFTVAQQRAARRPDVSADFDQSVEQNVSELVLGIHMPLGDFGGIRNTILSAQKATDQAQDLAAQARQQVTQQVAQGYSDYLQGQMLASSYKTRILAPSETLLGMTQEGYQRGKMTILDVLDAENDVRTARTGFVSSLLSLYKASDELRAAEGGEDPPVISVPGTAPVPAAAPAPVNPPVPVPGPPAPPAVVAPAGLVQGGTLTGHPVPVFKAPIEQQWQTEAAHGTTKPGFTHGPWASGTRSFPGELGE